MGINCDKISSQEESESNTRRVPFPETRIIKSWVVSITTSHKQTETNWDWSNLLGCHTAILSVAWHPNRWLRKKLAHSEYNACLKLVNKCWTSLHFDRRVSKARLEFDICWENQWSITIELHFVRIISYFRVWEHVANVLGNDGPGVGLIFLFFSFFLNILERHVLLLNRGVFFFFFNHPTIQSIPIEIVLTFE